MPDLVRLSLVPAHASGAVRAQGARLARGFGGVMDDVAELYRVALVQRTPVSHSGGPRSRAGRTRAGWKVRREGRGLQATRVVYNTQDTLRFVLQGRAAIDMRTRTGPARHPLHFWIDGEEFYRWHVKAAPANNFVPAAMRAARAQVRRQFPDATRQLMARSGVRAL
jgi:hypothetical protein